VVARIAVQHWRQDSGAWLKSDEAFHSSVAPTKQIHVD